MCAQRGTTSYTTIVADTWPKLAEKEENKLCFTFNSSEEQRQRLQKEYVDKTLISGAAYNIQIHM